MSAMTRDGGGSIRATVACALLVLAPLLAPAVDASPAALRVAYSRSESALDRRAEYPLAILRLALERSGRDFVLEPSPAPMQQARALVQLAKGEGIDVVWTMTSIEREATLRPIRFPIERGLVGWRLLLVRGDDVARFRDIHTVAGLAQLRTAQGHDWPDVPILEHAGLPVEPVSSYEALFAMLEAGRIDYLPRSVMEIADELAQRRSMGMVIEPDIVLVYPTGFYFFVHPDNHALAEAIERGLEASLRDGSFQHRFEQEFAAVIEQTGLRQRRAFRLENPLLPSATPLHRRELWFDLPSAAENRR